MTTAEQFVDKLWEENQVMYKASQIQIKAFYDSNPSKEKLHNNFVRRMTNERMNLVEIAKSVAEAPFSTDPKELMGLAKQALDEANHFRIVHDIIPHISGKEVNLGKEIPAEMADLKTKGARIAERYNIDTDEVARALYQFIVEGHAAENWQVMADNLEDPVLKASYAKIAADERSHRDLGKNALLKVLDTQEKVERAQELAKTMRRELFDINAGGNIPVEESRKMIEDYYGEDYLAGTRFEGNTVELKTIYGA